MNSSNKIITLCIIFQIFKLVKCNNNEVLCEMNLIDSDGKLINETTFCKPKPCLISMCKQNEVQIKRRCVNINGLSDLNLSLFQAVYKYNGYGELLKTNKSIWDAFNIVRFQNRTMLTNSNCVKTTSWVWANGNDSKPYFFENGGLVIDVLNQESAEPIPALHYVVWFTVPENPKEYTTLSLRIKEIVTNVTSPDLSRWRLFCAIGMFISCFFLILVLVVYGMLKELQNLVGLILMAFLGTLTCGFLFKASRSLGVLYSTITVEQCTIISPITNFMQISSFTWLNVLSFDVWWKFRSIYYNRPTNRRGVWNKFTRYAMCAWGTPLLLIIAEVVIDNLDLHHIPHFIKPDFKHCSVGTTKWYSLAPITFILAVNLMLFMLTTYNVWRVRREMSRFNKFDAKKNKENENMFVLCLKLSILTGFNWIFDLLSNFKVFPEWLETMADVYNVFIGVVIFMAFVFKTHILLKLCKKFSIENKLTRLLEKRMDQRMTFKSSSKKTTESDYTGMQEIKLGDVSKGQTYSNSSTQEEL